MYTPQRMLRKFTDTVSGAPDLSPSCAYDLVGLAFFRSRVNVKPNQVSLSCYKGAMFPL